jgi:hypothetical protein
MAGQEAQLVDGLGFKPASIRDMLDRTTDLVHVVHRDGVEGESFMTGLGAGMSN